MDGGGDSVETSKVKVVAYVLRSLVHLTHESQSVSEM